MKRFLTLAFLTLWFLMAPAVYGQSCPGLDTTLIPKGYQQLTVSTSAVKLTVPAATQMAVIHVEAQAVRYRDDNVAPTTSVGISISAGGTLTVCTTSLSKIQFIRDDASDATLNILYYGY